MALRDGYYPVVIRESRYNGTYSGGKFILTAGLSHPTEAIDAWGSDTDAMRFWMNRRRDGPFIRVRDAVHGGKREVYVAAGDDPADLLQQFLEATEAGADD